MQIVMGIPITYCYKSLYNDVRREDKTMIYGQGNLYLQWVIQHLVLLYFSIFKYISSECAYWNVKATSCNQLSYSYSHKGTVILSTPLHFMHLIQFTFPYKTLCSTRLHAPRKKNHRNAKETQYSLDLHQVSCPVEAKKKM